MGFTHAARGVTLPELITAMGITGILIAAATPSLGPLLLRRHLEGVAAQVHADLQYLRSEAAARGTGVRMTFHADDAGSCYVIHAGPAGACRCEAASPPQCGPGTPALRAAGFDANAPVQVLANVASLRVDPLHGTVSPAATLRVVAHDGSALHHIVSILGRVRTCALAAPWAGVAPCTP